MEEKALKWETPYILCLSMDKTHGKPLCDVGGENQYESCKGGNGASINCNPYGTYVGHSGTVCITGDQV